MADTALAPEHEQLLEEHIAAFADNPLGFVLFAFDWGNGDLTGQTGPDAWQEDILRLIGDKCLTIPEALRVAVASGHGIGKSALVAWIIIWFASTRPHCNGVVTANTRNQLIGKTWRELALWHKRSINAHWFDWTATKFAYKQAPETWFVAAVPWSEHNSEAFAGLHAEHVLMLFDEASAVADTIWDVAEGALTTTGAMWLAFGNPTRNTGRFRETFGRFRHRWHTRQVDSRNAKMANQAQIAQWVEDYGEDSDFVRIRVRGEFPRAGSTQFISLEDVEAATKRKPSDTKSPRIMGVDVARFGDDQSVILLRAGNNIEVVRKYRGLRVDQFANMVAGAINELKPDAVFIDGVGLGAGVVDILTGNKFKVDDINGGTAPLDPKSYANLRAEMWGKMRDWLMKGGVLPDEKTDADNAIRELKDDLIAVEYGYNNQGAIQLEKKEDMKARGLASPDVGDALALTFARPVASAEAQAALDRRFHRAVSQTHAVTSSRPLSRGRR